jgi:signal transduction histidine kinase
LPYDVQVYTESLESILFPDPGAQNDLKALYTYKYRSRKPDVIIALGPAPIKLLVASRKEFFPGTPIVFCGSTKEQANDPELDSSFTGAWMTAEPEKTVQAALRLRPETRHLALVGGDSAYDKSVEDIARKSLRGFEDKLDLIDLIDLDMPSLLSRVKRLPENTIILFTSLTQDATGTHFVNPTQSLPMVADAANVPTFGLSDTFLGHGVVGGRVVSFAAQGQIVAADTIKILQGAKPQEIPIVQSTNVYMFDWRALKRWGLSERNLPSGSIVLYREPTLWQRHGRLVLATILVTSLLALLSGYLLMERRRRRLAELELQREAEFQRLISELSTYFIDLRADKIDIGIDSALSQIAQALEVDRLSMFEFVNNGTDLRMTHCSTKEAERGRVNLLTGQDFAYGIARLSNNQSLVLPNLDQVAEMSAKEREFMRSRGIEACVFVPLEAGEEVLGALCFISKVERQWSEGLVEQFKMLAQIFSNALARKRADEALLTSELLKGAILSSLSSNVVVTDRNGEILSTNSLIEPTFFSGTIDSASEFSAGANCLDVYRRASKAGNAIASEILSGIQAVLEGGRSRVESEWTKDYAGGRKWFLTSVTRLKTNEGGLVITHAEITNRKRAEEDRLELSGQLIDFQEKERSRLARELHDDFNQRLAVLAFDLERTAQTVSNSSVEAGQRLHELWNRASEIGADLHSLSHSLHSSTLESLGLVLGVSSLCGEFAEQHQIQVDFAHENIPRSVQPDIALCLFRVAQEGLRNVKRHSGASRAEVRLEGMRQAISLSIADKGMGFDSHASRARAGLGIRSMQERLRLLGGHFEIRSQPGQGTVIRVWVPLTVKSNHTS